MPGATEYLGTGTTITFGTSGFSAELRSLSWVGIERVAVETTPLGVTTPGSGFGNRTFLPSIAVDGGTLQCRFKFNPDLTPPVNLDPETVTVTFPLVTGDTTPASWSATGFFISYSPENVGLDELIEATADIKITGGVSITQAA